MSDAVEQWNPNGGLVVEAFLGRILGTTDLVAMSLPSGDAWRTRGFVTYMSLSGTPSLELPVRKPIYRLDSWAGTKNAGSGAPPWGTAFQNIERIREAVEGQVDQSPFSMTKPNYRQARMLSAYLTTEPREIKGDPQGLARVQADLAVEWVVEP